MFRLFQSCRPPGFQARERAHFDAIVERTGDTWWGNSGEGGIYRLERRAELIAGFIREDSRVLELGCGTGAITLPLLRRLPKLRLEAVDISPAALEVAARRAAKFQHAKFRLADVLGLSELESFDVIVGNGILHHLPLQAACCVLGNVAASGGKVVFFEPNLLNPHVALEKLIWPVGRLLGNTPDEQAFTRFRISKALRAAGFEAISVTPIEFVHPQTPGFLLGIASRAGSILEGSPLLRELAGSLFIVAGKQPSGSPVLT